MTQPEALRLADEMERVAEYDHQVQAAAELRRLYEVNTTPRQWQGLTDEDVKAPIQRAMQYFGFDSTQYSLGGAATIGFYGLVKEIETKLREKNRD